MSEKLFVDSHCHLFNIVDIPLYDTIAGKVAMGTLGRLVAAFGAGGAIASGLVGKKFHEYEEFIRFFERSIERNVLWLAGQMRETLQSAATLPNDVHTILITPLVMDFDYIHYQSESSQDEPNVFQQLKRLRRALADPKVKTKLENEIPAVKICPFIGLDLRKLTNPQYAGMYDDLKNLWVQEGVTAAKRADGISALVSGDVVGVKLYPAIGFNPYPKKSKRVQKYLEFYTWCCEGQIPLTVHCQPGSYSVDSSASEVRNRTHSRNWMSLLNDHVHLQELRINFAHFGGEGEMEEMFDAWRKGGLEEGTWTHILIKLLQQYSNTYADISAYDYADRGACKNLVNLFERDHANTLGGGENDNRLSKKLIWGSDVPMIISGDAYRQGKKGSGEANYKYYYQRFQNALFSSKKLSDDVVCKLIESLTKENPCRFLGF